MRLPWLAPWEEGKLTDEENPLQPKAHGLVDHLVDGLVYVLASALAVVLTVWDWWDRRRSGS